MKRRRSANTVNRVSSCRPDCLSPRCDARQCGIARVVAGLTHREIAKSIQDQTPGDKYAMATHQPGAPRNQFSIFTGFPRTLLLFRPCKPRSHAHLRRDDRAQRARSHREPRRLVRLHRFQRRGQDDHAAHSRHVPRASAGTAKVLGHDVVRDADAVRHVIGYMPDFFGV